MLRACLYSLVKFLPQVWLNMWENVPIVTEFLFTGSQLVYDIWPILLIMKQHHRTFRNEERYETSLVMDRFTSSTFIATSGKDVSLRGESMDEFKMQSLQAVERMRARTTDTGRRQGQHPYHNEQHGPRTPDILPRFGSDADVAFEEREASTVKFKQSGFRITEKNVTEIAFGPSEGRRESRVNPSEEDHSSPETRHETD